MVDKKIQKVKSRRGRPKEDPEYMRTHRAVIYLNRQQYEILRMKAGIASISSYVREKLFGF